MSTRIEKSDLARDALYEKVNTIADELDSNKVSKSGDTMTGNLMLSMGTPALFFKSTSLDLSSITDSKSDAYIVLRDKNNIDGSYIRFRHEATSGGTGLAAMIASVGTGSNRKTAELQIGVDVNGNFSTSCPKPADASNNNSIATTNWAGGLNRSNTWTATNTFKGPIELSPANNPNHGGYIDFHYNGSTSDYTSRIIESSEHVLQFTNSVEINGYAKFSSNVSFSGSGSITFNNTNPVTISKNVTRVDNYATTYYHTQPRVNVNGNARYKCVCTGYTKGTAPTAIQFGGISTYDKNNVELATLYSSIDTNNTVTSALWVKQPTASGTTAKAISIYCDNNGVFHTFCGVASAENNSILTTVAHGDNYVKLGNGLIICWGCRGNNSDILVSNSWKGTVTFPIAFTQIPYVNAFVTDGGSTDVRYWNALKATLNGTSTTGFYLNVGNNESIRINWIAIGW